MQLESLCRGGSPSITEVSLYFPSILLSENKPSMVRFKVLTSSYLPCTLEGGLRERRLLSWGGIMMRSAGKRGCWKNKTSQQHSRWFYALYLCALGTWRLGGCRM